MMLAASGALGGVAGLHAATWGAYKDGPFEGFRGLSYLRSPGLGVAIALCVLGPEPDSPSILVCLGVVYALERLATEWWKAVLRDDDQHAYSIPMRLGYRGRPVDQAWLRHTVGLLILTALAGLACLIAAAQTLLPDAPPWAVVLTIGGVGGWATAIGGAWKDAPIEGFSGWKFLRSPAAATAWALPMSTVTADWLVLALASAGLAVASIETYKTFLTGGRPPGKFATKAVRFRMHRTRRALACTHASLWAVLAVALPLALPDPLDGLSVTQLDALAVQIPSALLAAVSAVAAALAALVRLTARQPVPARGALTGQETP